MNERQGLLCKTHVIWVRATNKIKTLKVKYLAVRGPKIFNCLPGELRDLDKSTEYFKNNLDKFLAKVPIDK